MKIVLDKKAIEYLDKKKADSISVSLIGCASWGVGEPQPTVTLGKPDDIDDFDVYTSDGKIVYVLCTIQARNNELHIKYSKILFMEKLIVEGIVF